MHVSHAILNFEQCLWTKHRFQFLQHLAAIHAQKHGALAGTVWHAQFDPHQKTVELRFGQWKCAVIFGWVLRRDDHKGLGQWIRLIINGNLGLAHGLQEAALGLGRRAIDLIREDDIGKNGARHEFKCLLLAIEHRDADDIGRKEVAGELYALK